MKRWLLLLGVACHCANSFAQIHQQTLGPSSPILNITGPGANVHISAPVQITNNTNISAALRALKATDDKDLKKARELLRQGQSGEARVVLQGYTAKQRKSFQNVALAKFSEAQILISNEDMSEASEALAVALALEPANCQYRAMTAFFYESTGRLDDARRLLYANADAEHCALNGDPREAGMLRLARVRLAAELRNEKDALREMHAAYAALSAARGDKAREDLGVKCLFLDFAKGYWNDKAEEFWPDAATACKHETLSELPGSSTTAVDVLDFYKDRSSSQEALAAGDAFFGKYRSLDDHAFLGFDRLRRRALFAQMKSDQGFRLFWSAGDPPAAARLYAQAYELMVPLVESARPSVLTNVAQLVIRIKHLESITTARVFPDTQQRLRYDIERAADLARQRGTVDSCESIARIRGAGWEMLTESKLKLLWERQIACLNATVPSGSFTDLRVRYDWADTTEKPSMETLDIHIALGEQLIGFPVISHLRGKQAFDRAIRLQLRPTARKTDEESIKQFRLELARAFDDALMDPQFHASRMVFSTWLLFMLSDDRATRAAQVLLSEPERSDSDSPYGLCLAQSLRLKELDVVGVFAAIYGLSEVSNKALSLLRREAAPGNLCRVVPKDRSMGVDYLADVVDRVLHQVAMIDQIDRMKSASALDEDFLGAPLTRQCLESDSFTRLPLCSFYLPKPARRRSASVQNDET